MIIRQHKQVSENNIREEMERSFNNLSLEVEDFEDMCEQFIDFAQVMKNQKAKEKREMKNLGIKNNRGNVFGGLVPNQKVEKKIADSDSFGDSDEKEEEGNLNVDSSFGDSDSGSGEKGENGEQENLKNQSDIKEVSRGEANKEEENITKQDSEDDEVDFKKLGEEKDDEKPERVDDKEFDKGSDDNWVLETPHGKDVQMQELKENE